MYWEVSGLSADGFLLAENLHELFCCLKVHGALTERSSDVRSPAPGADPLPRARDSRMPSCPEDARLCQQGAKLSPPERQLQGTPELGTRTRVTSHALTPQGAKGRIQTLRISPNVRSTEGFAMAAPTNMAVPRPRARGVNEGEGDLSPPAHTPLWKAVRLRGSWGGRQHGPSSGHWCCYLGQTSHN